MKREYSEHYDMACVDIGNNGCRILTTPKYKAIITMTEITVLKNGWVAPVYLDASGKIVAEPGHGLREWYPTIGKVVEVSL